MWFPFLLTLLIAAPATAQEVTRGTLHIVWDTEGSGAASHYVVDAAGRGTRIVADGSPDRLLPFARHAVEVRRQSIEPGAQAIDGRAVRMMEMSQLSGGMSGGGDRSAYDFVTVLCRFPEDPVPFSRAVVERAHGREYPGVANFFAELSWDPGMMQGSRVTDWYTLPNSRSEYVTETGTYLGALARDCTRAAESDVYFPSFFGINLQFSSGLSVRQVAPYDTLSFGGSWSLTLNGMSRTWGVTWLSAGHASTHVVLTHEIGHALGWPHSSGGYGSEYDSNWDVMSRGYLRWEPPHGWLAIHTIGHHKDASGWVPAHRRWEPSWGRVESGLLVRTALPPETGYLLARIPNGENSSFTVETRRVAGQDRPLPGEAVVIHRVVYGRAYVVDVDRNGDPNDEGAQWRPGEEFQDSVAGFSVRVDSATSVGFHVSVTRGWRLDLAAEGGRIIALNGAERVDCNAVCSAVAIERGTSIAVEAAPGIGTRFSHWEGSCSGTTPTCTVVLNGNRAVRAVFLPIVAIDLREMGRAVMGAEYRARLAITGKEPAVRWSLSDGKLPSGLTLDADSGTISGIPTAAGIYSFDLAATTATGAVVEQSVQLEVTTPSLRADAVLDQLLLGTGLSESDIRYMDLAGNRNGRLDVGDVRSWLQNTDASHTASAIRLRDSIGMGGSR